MRRVLHLSDVHFGTADPIVVGLVVAKANEIAPDVVVVSGDLTQRAKSKEFQAAKLFLDRLPRPQIVVPGNHDVPAYNLFARFFRPLHKFRKFITDDLTPAFIDDELAVVGVNTARSLVIKGGRINEKQVEAIQSKFCNLDDGLLKIVVTHHPFDLPDQSHHDEVVGRAEMAMPLIAECGGDVLLAGHLHTSHIETTAKRYKLQANKVALVVQAGTATSTRVRGEPHSFNLLEWDAPQLSIRRFERRGNEFVVAEEKNYLQIAAGWDRID